MAEKIPLVFEAEITDIRKKLGELPGITGKEARAMVGELNKNLKKAAKSVGESGLREAADDVGDVASKLAQGFGVISPQAQALATTVADLSDGFVGAASAGGGLGVALVGVAATAAGVLAVGAAVVGAGAALVGLVDYAADARDELEQLQRLSGVALVDPETAAVVSRAQAAMDALGVTVDAIAMSIAGQLAPGVQDTATLLVAMGLAAKDVIDHGVNLVDVAEAVGIAFLEGFTQPIDTAVHALAKLVSMAADLTDLAGLDGLSSDLSDAAAAAEGFDLGGSLIAMAGDALDGLTESVSSYLPAANKLVTAQGLVNRGLKEAKSGYQDALKAMDEDTAARQTAEEALVALVDAERQAAASQLDAIQKVEAARNDQLAGLLTSYQDGVSAAAGNDALLLQLAEQYEAARLAIVGNSEGQILAVRQEMAERWKAKQAEALKNEQQLESARFQIAQQSIQAASQVWGIYADARVAEAQALAASLADTTSEMTASERAAAEEQLADQQAKAMMAFRVSQGLALAQGTMAAWKAAAEAFAATAALGPVGLALAPAAAAATFAAIEGGAVAQIAAQEPPSFGDTPGVQRMDNQGMVRFARGDLFAAAKDPEELKRQVNNLTNTPRSMPAAPAVIIQQRGTVVDERVNRFRVNGPGALSRKLDRGDHTPGKRRK